MLDRLRPTTPSCVLRCAAALVTLIMVSAVNAAHAQVSANVPLEARAYEQLERLRALGVLDLLPSGQRPYSRRLVEQLVAAGWVNLPRLERDPARLATARRLLRELSATYSVVPDGASGHAPSAAEMSRSGTVVRLDAWTLEGAWLDSPVRPIEGAGMTFMDAAINPLVDARGGRAYADGFTGAAEVAVSGEIGGHLAIAAQPRFAALDARSADVERQVRIRQLSLTAGASNIAVTVGRIPLRLGQGIHRGLFASSNAPGLDMMHLGNDLPAYMPGFLRRIGPARGQIFLADLGPEQNHPHARLAGWKLSLWPSRSVEVGMSVLAQTGGDGAPPATFRDRVIDLLPLIDVLLYQDRDLQFSNKIAGVDARWRHGSGTELYLDAMVDDFDIRRVRSSLWDDGGIVAGFASPPLGRAGALRIEAEVQHTGLRFYEHAQFSSGLTFEQAIIGLPLGPRGDAVVSRVRWDTPTGSEWHGTFAVERRSEDQYRTTAEGPDDSGFRFVKVEDRPEELRQRAILGLSRPVGGGLRIEIEGGAERVTHMGFSEGAVRQNFLARLALSSGW